MNKPIMELIKVKKSYFSGGKELKILKGVNLELFEGEKVAIIGPSGVGKTTLLNIMGALDKPTEGKVLFRGKALNWQDEEFLNRFRRECVGFIFQLHYLIFELSVMENVILPGLIAGKNRRELEKKAETLLKSLGLWDRRDSTPDLLSGGERQRVAIIRALILKPPLILADEPTGNLDPQAAKEVIDEFFYLSKETKSTVVVVTHNMDIAKKMDRIFLLKNGFLVELQKTQLKQEGF